MKIKYILCILLILFTCGCTQINDMDIDTIIKRLDNHVNRSNVYHTGYKYYLPMGMQVNNYMAYNDVIEDEDNNYYLYVDLISYFNKKDFEYEVNSAAYYSSKINFDNKYGYIEINSQEDGKYLIEIMYNYAKIEVKVEMSCLKKAVSKAVSILSSMEYNDSVITNLLDEGALNYQEEIYNIFNVTSGDSNYLRSIDENEEENVGIEQYSFEDSDLIN